MVRAIGGVVPKAAWDTEAAQQAFEAAVREAQAWAANMLERWQLLVRHTTKWAAAREAGRGRMGTVLWAWHTVAQRNSGGGERDTRVVWECAGRRQH